MYSYWKLILCAAILCLSGTAQSTNKQLVFNVTGQPPLNNDSQNGFMDEVARESLNRIGYQLLINRQPAERGLRSANEGVIDAEMSRVKGIDKVYKNLIRVPEKIMDWEFVVFSDKKTNLDQGWQNLAKKNLAFITGWKILENNVPKSAFIMKTRDSNQLFQLLKRARTEHVIYERWGGNKLIRELNLNNVRMASPPLAVKEMYIYLHKRHRKVVPLLSNALKQMKTDGTYSALAQKHLGAFQ